MTEKQNKQKETLPEAPTKEVETPSGYKVEIKEWITGREKREIRKVYMKGSDKMKLRAESSKDAEQGKYEMEGIDSAAITDEVEDVSWRLVIVSIKDPKGNEIEGDVAEIVINLPGPDHDMIKDAVDDVTERKKK